MRAAYDSAAFSDFMAGRGFAKTWMDSAEAREFKSEDTAICDIQKAAGLN